MIYGYDELKDLIWITVATLEQGEWRADEDLRRTHQQSWPVAHQSQHYFKVYLWTFKDTSVVIIFVKFGH